MSTSVKPKVVFTFVEAGMGHIVPATGIADAFEKKYGKYCQVERWYVFRDSKYKRVRQYAKALVGDTKRINKSPLYSKLEDALSRSFSSKVNLGFVDFLNGSIPSKVQSEIAEKQPDLIFSTYYSPSHFAFLARKNGLVDCIVDTYSPDPFIYRVWDRGLSPYDLFFVNNDRAYKQALSDGFKAENVKKVPFVVRNEMLPKQTDKQFLRNKLGLPDKFTVVLVDGAYALGKMVEFASALLQCDIPLTVIAVCGRNEKALKKLTKAVAKPNVTFLPMGFVNNVIEYLYASDLFCGKSGAGVINECITAKLPMVVNHFGGVIEEHIADYYLRECKLGKIIFDVKEFVQFVETVASNCGALDEYKKQCEIHCDLSGGEKVADTIFGQLEEKFGKLTNE